MKSWVTSSCIHPLKPKPWSYFHYLVSDYSRHAVDLKEYLLSLLIHHDLTRKKGLLSKKETAPKSRVTHRQALVEHWPHASCILCPLKPPPPPQKRMTVRERLWALHFPALSWGWLFKKSVLAKNFRPLVLSFLLRYHLYPTKWTNLNCSCLWVLAAVCTTYSPSKIRPRTFQSP